MALNPLCLGTDGALRRGATKAVLVLGVAGMLHFGSEPEYVPGSGGGNLGYYNGSETTLSDNSDLQRKAARIKLNNEIVLSVIKIWMEQCQT